MQGKTHTKPMRIPPQDIEAEKALLGSIMVRSSALHEIADIVDTTSLYVDKHRIIYEAMLDLFRKNEPVDLVSVSSQLNSKKKLESIGGSAYLSELAALVPTSTNAIYYATQVAKKATLRKLIKAGDEIVELGFNESNDIEYAIDEAEKAIFAVGETTKQTNAFIGIKNILPQTWETVERLHETRDQLRGVPTGFRELDNKLSGLQKADLIILAARPSMGKTSLALDIARNAALRYQIPVGIFSLEMSAQQLTDRMVSAEGQVDSWKMRTGKQLTEKDFDDIQEAMNRLSTAPIFIDDTPANTILRMRSTARRLKSQHGLGLIVVDYLQLMHTTKNHDSMVNQVTEISRSLKALARELEVPVLALSQLSRAVEQRGGKPRLSDLRDSGSIEQDADVVMFIHRESKDEGGREQMAEVLIEKHRNGPTGRAELFFDGDKTSFLDVEKTSFDNFGESNNAPF